MTNSVSRLICHKIVCLLIFHVWNLWKGVKSIIWKPWTVEISYLRLNMLKLMNTLPVPYTNSWQISNDSNSTDQNYMYHTIMMLMHRQFINIQKTLLRKPSILYDFHDRNGLKLSENSPGPCEIPQQTSLRRN